MMSKQRNEPSDPAAELAGYDFSNSEGSSADNDGAVETDNWPEELDRQVVTETGIEIIEKWVNSQYNKITESNLREFEKQHDHGKSTVRTWIYRAFPNQRGYEDLREGEKKAALIHAAYGDDYNFKELVEYFEITDPDLTFARHGVPDIVDGLQNRHTKEKLQSEARKFLAVGELPDDSNSNGESDSDTFDKYYNYFTNNPDAKVDTARDDVGINATNREIGRAKGNAVMHLKTQSGDSDNTKGAEKENEAEITIKIKLSRERAREIVVSQSLPETVREKVINNILDTVGL